MNDTPVKKSPTAGSARIDLVTANHTAKGRDKAVLRHPEDHFCFDVEQLYPAPDPFVINMDLKDCIDPAFTNNVTMYAVQNSVNANAGTIGNAANFTSAGNPANVGNSANANRANEHSAAYSPAHQAYGQGYQRNYHSPYPQYGGEAAFATAHQRDIQGYQRSYQSPPYYPPNVNTGNPFKGGNPISISHLNANTPALSTTRQENIPIYFQQPYRQPANISTGSPFIDGNPNSSNAYGGNRAPFTVPREDILVNFQHPYGLPGNCITGSPYINANRVNSNANPVSSDGNRGNAASSIVPQGHTPNYYQPHHGPHLKRT